MGVRASVSLVDRHGGHYYSDVVDMWPGGVTMTAQGPAEVDQVESMILGVFRSVLGNQSVGPEDDFFATGGDSLLAVDAAERIATALSAPLDPLTLFMYPTAAACARTIVGDAAAS
jgi:Phosphopantetheine attachment site